MQKRLNEILNIEFPIIQGGMSNIANGTFAAAVSNAGGLGIVASGGMNPEKFRQEIRLCRSLTDKPFGVNIMLMQPEVDQLAQIAAEEQVALITTGAGNPAKYIEKWKNSGALVAPVIPAVALAQRVVQYGADMVIAEGTESGGHVGEMTTLALVPQVVDAVNVPVVAAGGIGDGRGLACAFALGAVGVQMGTILLSSIECPIHENYKNALIKAKDSDTVVTGRIGGAPVRILKNKMSREYLKKEKEGAGREELEVYTLGSLRKAVFDGDCDYGSLMAGQVAGMIKEIRPLRSIFEQLMKECDSTIKGLVE